MKKMLLLSVALGVLLFSQSCKKEAAQPFSNSNPTTGVADINNEFTGTGHCRFSYLHYEESGISFFFHYSNRGLVDNFTIDYGDGLPDVFNFTYNDHGLMNGGTVTYNYDNTHFDLKLFYTGNKIVRELWYDQGTTNIVYDVRNTYDFRGEITKRNNIATNTYCTFTYNFLGNSPSTSYYQDGELLASYDYTFHQFNRNPWTAVPGLTTGIPALYLIFTRWWETSEKTTLYDGGVADVIEDFDPEATVMQLGQQGYLASIKNHDRITDEDLHTSFEYENCGGGPAAPLQREMSTSTLPVKNRQMIITAKIKRLLMQGHSKNLKADIKELRNQSTGPLN